MTRPPAPDAPGDTSRPRSQLGAGGDLPSVSLHPDLEAPLSKGHPWIYKDHLPRGARFAAGTWVRVVSGAFRGVGIFDPDSALALRIYERDGRVPDADWFRQQVRGAYQRRAPLLADGLTDAYRLLNGEGDGVPGIVVDVYGAFAVLRPDSPALGALTAPLVAALMEAVPLEGVCQKSSAGLSTLSGRPPPAELIVSEHGLRFFADLGAGQKTGLFLDQRENRNTIGPWCNGCSVLNLFSYTGGFSLYAARGGARHVVSVDRAADAMARARDNVALNGFDPDLFEFVTADALSYLESLARARTRFDVVISDPPSFARNRMQRKGALRAYERLHTLALDVLAPGGLYAAGSCTSQVDVESFRDTVARAAVRARRTLQIVLDAGHALDHPVMVGHPEGRYLKFLALRSVAESWGGSPESSRS